VSLSSLARYRRSLGDFVRLLPISLGSTVLRPIEGGLAS
jgi:hypothetical protein